MDHFEVMANWYVGNKEHDKLKEEREKDRIKTQAIRDLIQGNPRLQERPMSKSGMLECLDCISSFIEECPSKGCYQDQRNRSKNIKAIRDLIVKSGNERKTKLIRVVDHEHDLHGIGK
jgi:hypothetical protein